MWNKPFKISSMLITSHWHLKPIQGTKIMKLIDMSYEQIMSLDENIFYDKFADFFLLTVASKSLNMNKPQFIQHCQEQGDLTHNKSLFTAALNASEKVLKQASRGD